MTAPARLRGHQQVPGHVLLRDGDHPRPARFTDDGRLRLPAGEAAGRGRCSCGALSGPDLSQGAIRDWHNAHKAAVLAAR